MISQSPQKPLIIPTLSAEELQLAECYPTYAKALAQNSGDRQVDIDIEQKEIQTTKDDIGLIVCTSRHG